MGNEISAVYLHELMVSLWVIAGGSKNDVCGYGWSTIGSIEKDDGPKWVLINAKNLNHWRTSKLKYGKLVATKLQKELKEHGVVTGSGKGPCLTVASVYRVISFVSKRAAQDLNKEAKEADSTTI